MTELLNKDLKIMVMTLESQPNNYYVSYNSEPKCVINTIYTQNNDVILKCIPQEHCTAEELNAIIDHFSSYICAMKSDLNGVILDMDPNDLLESIGFKLENEDDDYLYRKNNRKVK